MKKFAFVTIVGMLLLISCGPRNNKQAKLDRLESKRDTLTEQIEQLKQEIAEERDSHPKEERSIHVRIAEINPEPFKHFIQVQGTVESDNNILIAPQSSGLVKKIYVKAGDKVSAGQLLAELDGAILESSAAELEHSLELATTIFERQQRLWNKHIGSEIEYLQAKNNKEGLEKKLETLREQYKLTKITSPLAGSVDEVFIKEGEMTAAGFGAIQVVQLTNLKIKAELSENYISKVKKKDVVTVNIPVLERKFNHSIAAVSQVIDPQNRTFHIEIKIPPAEKTIKPNMLAVVTINDYSNPEALTVPRKVIQETGNEQFLFVAVNENSTWRAQKRIVKAGKEYNEEVEILSGLDRGEYIVSFGFQNLADGQKLAVDIE